MKTNELTGAALDWAVAKCEGGFDLHQRTDWHNKPWAFFFRDDEDPERVDKFYLNEYKPSADWSQGGPIIERENISVIRLDDESIPDAKGFWQGKYVPQWGAVIGDRHSAEEQHGSQGDYWGRSYHVDEDAVCGETPLIAAMRCYVASKLGDNVEIPEELTS